MRSKENIKLDVYYSRHGKVKVSKSHQHKDLFNIEEVDTRMAHTLLSSDENILKLYPKDEQTKK